MTQRFRWTAAAWVLPCFLWVSLAATLNYTIWTMSPNAIAGGKPTLTAVAVRLTEGTDKQGFPTATSWNKAGAVMFDHDWKGQNSTPPLATEVRLLWTPETLFLRFVSKYQSLNTFPDARNDGWRDQLWDRDVAETFLQPDDTDPLKYKEFEVSPNGFWIDLDISHGAKQELESKLKRRVVLDEKGKSWTAELAIPMKSLTETFDAKHDWRVNFYRVEGAKEPRFYSAWSPTGTAEPNFHVPGAFGTLAFR